MFQNNILLLPFAPYGSASAGTLSYNYSENSVRLLSFHLRIKGGAFEEIRCMFAQDTAITVWNNYDTKNIQVMRIIGYH